MNKTTIKISVLAFLGFMTYGYAQQQQQDPYRGKVGINTVTPSATMDVQPNSDNARVEAKTNEGIIAPKLSKTRIANIETPVEGTLVYATDANYTSVGNTAVDTKVAKITEKGYYFYNGTEWVKAGSDVNSGEWVYDPVTKRINLKRSGQATGFVNKVFYDAETGKKIVASHENFVDEYHNTDGTISTIVVDLSTKAKALDNNISLASSFPTYTTSNGTTFKHFKFNKMMIDATTGASHLRLSENRLNVNSDNANDYSSVYSDTNIADLYGTGKISNALGSWGQVNIGNSQNIGSYTSGMLGVMGVYTSGTVANAYSIYGRAFFGSPGIVNQFANLMLTTSHMSVDNTLVKSYLGIRNSIVSDSQNTGTGNLLVGIYSTIRHKGKTKYPKMYGNYIENIITPEAVAPNDQYGLYIAPVVGALNSNYSIYTKAGNIRFGDLQHSVSTNVASTGDRPVFVTADGVLKVGNASTALSRAVWETDGNHVKLAVKADGTDRTDNIITINDEGQMFASSFKGTNGATIFPDYVFQKYYTGTSSIKADYNFKSLSQVEDFVKANGHLPGYKSAATIKAQGYVDLMETQLTNVEKIEELYLHSIEQDKVNKQQAEALKAKESKIQELEAKNAALESRLERLEKLIQ